MNDRHYLIEFEEVDGNEEDGWLNDGTMCIFADNIEEAIQKMKKKLEPSMKFMVDSIKLLR